MTETDFRNKLESLLNRIKNPFDPVNGPDWEEGLVDLEVTFLRLYEPTSQVVSRGVESFEITRAVGQKDVSIVCTTRDWAEMGTEDIEVSNGELIAVVEDYAMIIHNIV